MKRIFFLLPLIACWVAGYSQDHPVFKFSQGQSPKEVYRLGTNPEFPFLRHLSTPQQVANALRSKANAQKYPAKMKELNQLLMSAGFANGAKDVQASNITAMDVPAGTTGNMGDGHLHYMYVRFAGGNNYKAWKISSGSNYIAFLGPCGNAFYGGPAAEAAGTSSGNMPRCREVALNEGPKEMTVDGTVERQVTKKTYVYFEEKDCCSPCGCGEVRKSRPILWKTEEVTEAVPTTYKVKTDGRGTALICNDTLKAVDANLTIESSGEYTGYKPEVRKEYVKVSEREYWEAWHAKYCGCDDRD